MHSVEVNGVEFAKSTDHIKNSGPSCAKHQRLIKVMRHRFVEPSSVHKM